MLDQRMRRLLAPGLESVARRIAATGVRANHLSLAGAGLGLAAGLAIAGDSMALAIGLALVSRLADGLDGPLARLRGGTDFGGYLDIVCDFVFYVAIPLGFAVRDPSVALPTAFVLAGYVLTGVSFLAYASVAERRGVTDDADNRSFIFQPGLAEGSETLLFYFTALLLPGWYASLAWFYALVCFYTATSRSVLAWRVFRDG